MPEKKYGYVKKSTYYNGHRYYVYAKTEREARRKLVALQAELEANGARLDGTTTVKKWSQDWMEVYVKSRDITAKSAAMYRQKLDKYILPEIGAMRLCDVRDVHLKRLLNKANSSYSTAQKVRIVLQAMFKQARKSRLIPYDPSEDLELPKAPKGTRHSISETLRAAILAVAEYHRAGLFVLLMLFCGLRPGEIAALQWKDIDKKEHTIDVTKALESGDYTTEKDPKTSAGRRTICMPEQIWDRVEAERKGPFDYVLLQPKGKKRHTESSLFCLWRSFKRELDIYLGADVYRNQIIKHCWEVHWELVSQNEWEALVPYSLRHTFCTDLQRAGVPLNVARYIMGHSDISVTAKIYTDSTPEVVFSAAKNLADFYKNSDKKQPTEDMEIIASSMS